MGAGEERKGEERRGETELRGGSYWLTRIVFIRCLAFVYNVAFLVAYNQNGALIGRRGLLPADLYLADLRRTVGNPSEPMALLSVAPTLFWFVPPHRIDFYLQLVAMVGMGLSFLILLSGAANMGALALLWVLYQSILNVGQRWYSFGWESQLVETGFLAICWVPVASWQSLPRQTPPSKTVVYAYRWLIFRIMIGAGLIKLRGDECWQWSRLSCMDYHYETQPVPNPVAYFLHQSPRAIHRLEVVGNHFVECLAPFLLFLPFRRLNISGGLIQIAFMGIIIISGNLSFLNHLTMLPSICALDDRFLGPLFSQSTREKVARLQIEEPSINRCWGVRFRRVVNVALGCGLAYLSIPVVHNLFFSTRQQMNTSFEPLRLLNTYGAFGSITKERTEIIMQGTAAGDPQDPSAVWEEYEFQCKPGQTDRRPCLMSPYHYRLDWLMWFAAFQNYQSNPWLIHLVAKMLQNDRLVSELLAHNPFLHKSPPKFIRLVHYRYSYTRLGSKGADWWKRRRLGQYLGPVSLHQLRPILQRFAWDRKL